MHIKQQFVCWVFCPNFPKFVFRRRWGHLKAFKLLWRSMLRFHFSFYSYFSANQIKLSPSQSLFSPSPNLCCSRHPSGGKQAFGLTRCTQRRLIGMSQLFPAASPFRGSAHSVRGFFFSSPLFFFSPSTSRYFVGLWISSDLRAITLGSVTRQSAALPRLLVGDVSSR